MKLVPDWRLMLQAWSVRLNAIGVILLGWFAVDPVSVLAVWNMMPAAVRDLVPSQIVSITGAVLFAFAFLSKFVRQPKLEEKRDAAAKD